MFRIYAKGRDNISMCVVIDKEGRRVACGFRQWNGPVYPDSDVMPDQYNCEIAAVAWGLSKLGSLRPVNEGDRCTVYTNNTASAGWYNGRQCPRPLIQAVKDATPAGLSVAGAWSAKDSDPVWEEMSDRSFPYSCEQILLPGRMPVQKSLLNLGDMPVRPAGSDGLPF